MEIGFNCVGFENCKILENNVLYVPLNCRFSFKIIFGLDMLCLIPLTER